MTMTQSKRWKKFGGIIAIFVILGLLLFGKIWSEKKASTFLPSAQDDAVFTILSEDEKGDLKESQREKVEQKSVPEDAKAVADFLEEVRKQQEIQPKPVDYYLSMDAYQELLKFGTNDAIRAYLIDLFENAQVAEETSAGQLILHLTKDLSGYNLRGEGKELSASEVYENYLLAKPKKIDNRQVFEGDEQLVYQALYAADEKDKRSAEEFYVYAINVVDAFEKGGIRKIYTCVYAESFLLLDNGKLSREAGYAMPMLITYQNKGGQYEDPKISYPRDGSEYPVSIREFCIDRPENAQKLIDCVGKEQMREQLEQSLDQMVR